MTKEIFNSSRGPEAKGAYSTAVSTDGLVFVSGQGPVDPETGEIVRGTVEEEAERAFENVRIILHEMDLSTDDVVKVTLYLDDMDNFSRVNEVYADYFGPDYPARTCIGASSLPFDIQVEIEVIACRQ